jgi:predicted lipoprotein
MKKLLLPFLLLITLSACDEKGTEITDGGSGEPKVNPDFKRKNMLISMADTLIIPAYENFDSEIKKMKASESDFVDAPTETTLVALQTNWQNAYLAWQKVAMFEIGKAEELFFRDFMNSYPTSVNTVTINGSEVKGINQNITSGTYNLALPSNRSVQGFPALDYLLHGLGTDNAEILTYYTTNTSSSNYKNYLSDVVTRMESLSSQVLESWKTTYRNDFVNNDGSSANSSTSKLLNSYILNYENRIRNLKVAVPAGIRSTGVVFEDKVEAYYKNDISKALLLEALNASQDFFNGKFGDQEVTSVKSYLKAYQDVNPGEDLIAVINSNFDNARTKIDLLGNSFSEQVKDETKNKQMLATYDALQKNVVSLKLDMAQALNISITYADADGD